MYHQLLILEVMVLSLISKNWSLTEVRLDGLYAEILKLEAAESIRKFLNYQIIDIFSFTVCNQVDKDAAPHFQKSVEF